MIQPSKPFLLLLYIVGIISTLMFFLPEKINLSDNLSLKFFNYDNTILKEEVKRKDIAQITERFDRTKQPKKIVDSVKTKESPQKTPKKPRKFDPTQYQKDTLSFKVKIQYPKNNHHVLDNFFESLEGLDLSQKKELIRVIHYGDSQLEGDRMTAYMRNRFQEEFGGCGAGMQPLTNKMNSKISVVQSNDPAWQYYPIFGRGYSRKIPKTFGMLANYYRFGKPIPKNADSTTAPKHKAKVTYNRSGMAHTLDQKLENVKVLLRNPNAPVQIDIFFNDINVESKEVPSSKDPVLVETPVKGNFAKVVVKFESTSNPEIYGVGLDCNEGVVFDNVPIRGSSGLDFTKMDQKNLSKQIKALNVKLLIVQYGVNVDQTLSNYNYYQKAFYNQLKFFKGLDPDLDILVIGTSDRSFNKSGDYVSYPNIEKLRDAQRNAAFKAGCAFWDLFEVMGGRNSMPSWVFNKPALAAKDFTHFTLKGAGIVSEALCEALLLEYGKYTQKGKQQ